MQRELVPATGEVVEKPEDLFKQSNKNHSQHMRKKPRPIKHSRNKQTNDHMSLHFPNSLHSLLMLSFQFCKKWCFFFQILLVILVFVFTLSNFFHPKEPPAYWFRAKFTMLGYPKNGASLGSTKPAGLGKTRGTALLDMTSVCLAERFSRSSWLLVGFERLG